MVRRLILLVVCTLAAVTGLTATSYADSPSTRVTGPITGGNGAPVLFSHTSFPLASVGYRQSEYFLDGVATAYSSAVPLATNGKWKVRPSSRQPYRTRVVVDRPIDRRRFNGTVIVEWLNVSGGADASPDWMHTHTELIRRGYVWIGVSAQAVGVNALKTTPTGDPARYATLTHPGDSYSYDIYSQAGRAVRHDAGLLLGGLKPRHVIAIGESQSAARLTTYIDAVHPLANVYDGFLVHSRISPAGAPLSQAPLADVSAPSPTFVRTDTDVPTLMFQTETDTGGLLTRRPDTRLYREWEVAGTAHFDLYGLQTGATDDGSRQPVADWFNSMLRPPTQPQPAFTCSLPINTGPQTFVLRAAVAALDRWVSRGTPPPSAPRLQTVSVQPPQYALDANGNARGGIRTPAVDSPVAALSGLGNGGAQFCAIFGTTVPFSSTQLAALYHDHAGFVAAWDRAIRSAVKAGFVLPADADHLRAAAARSSILR